SPPGSDLEATDKTTEPTDDGAEGVIRQGGYAAGLGSPDRGQRAVDVEDRPVAFVGRGAIGRLPVFLPRWRLLGSLEQALGAHDDRQVDQLAAYCRGALAPP